MSARGTLFLIPAPLGESTEWSSVLPAATREIACRISHFVVENAKSARQTLKWLGHPGPFSALSIEPLPERPDEARLSALLTPLFAGEDLGLLSDAGCPGIADPGAALVLAAHRRGLQVRPLVGPSAILLAMMAAGLEGQRFAFHGYLPQREPQRSQRIRELERLSARRRETQIFIETPYRNHALLAALCDTCHADTLLCLACDLTLSSENILTQSIADWRRRLANAEIDYARRPAIFLLLAASPKAASRAESPSPQRRPASTG